MRKLKVLVVFMILSAFIQQYAIAATFSDVPEEAWFFEYVDSLTNLGIVSGYGDGTFRPGLEMTRGEFLALMLTNSGITAETKTQGTHWAEKYWIAALENGILDCGVEETVFSFGAAEDLNKPVTRYEMAVIVSNTLVCLFGEERIKIKKPENVISDYEDIPEAYRDAVEQCYGKGIITGDEAGRFNGEGVIVRAHAAVLMCRILFEIYREPADFSDTPLPELPDTPAAIDSFALRYRTMTPMQQREALFGNPDKTYFSSAEDAALYMTTVTVPIWKMASDGSKYASSASLQVHKLVADEVRAIFNEIYASPERFPIQSISGARFTDTMRHSWGCAIDINPVQNYYCKTVNGELVAIVGTHYLPYEDPYSITPDGSVVSAFRKYGWGWGGQGYSSGYYDFMHFSILPSGG